MAYMVDTTTTIYWVPDGANVQSNPSGPSFMISSGPVSGTLGAVPLVVVAGGDTPTSAQILAAFTAGGTANGAALTAAQIAQIQAFATGGN